MKSIYLDQNKWIELAKRFKTTGGTDPLYTQLQNEVDKKNICFPLSAIHMMETIKRADKKSRSDVLKVMIDLSKGFSLLSFLDVEEAEVINAFAKFHDPSKRVDFQTIRPQPFYVTGGIPTLYGIEHLPSDVQQEIHAIFNECITNPEVFYKLIGLVDTPEITKADNNDQAEYLKTMAERRSHYMGIPAKYRYKAYLIYNVCSIIDLHKQSILQHFCINDYKKDLLPRDAIDTEEKTMVFLESIPTVDVRIRLNYDLLLDQSYSFMPHDFLDILFLSTAVPYCDCVVTERTWRHRVTKCKLDTKYNTFITDKLESMV